jgi:hypothetical protein
MHLLYTMIGAIIQLSTMHGVELIDKNASWAEGGSS